MLLSPTYAGAGKYLETKLGLFAYPLLIPLLPTKKEDFYSFFKVFIFSCIVATLFTFFHAVWASIYRPVNGHPYFYMTYSGLCGVLRIHPTYFAMNISLAIICQPKQVRQVL